MEKEVLTWQQLGEQKKQLLMSEGNRGLKWECLGKACPVSCCTTYAYARLFIHEIVPVSRYFPISFIAMNPQEEKQGLVLCYLTKTVESKRSCIYLEEGRGCLLRDERPIACKQYPFAVDKAADGGNEVCVKPACPGLSPEHGMAILLPDNTIASDIEREFIKPAIVAVSVEEETMTFIEALNNNGLIVDAHYEHRGINLPVKCVDESRLPGLPPETLREFKAKGYMELISAQISSLENCKKLIDSYLDGFVKSP